MTVEHILPRCLGGGSSRTNVAVSHKGCNNARHADDDRRASYIRTFWLRWSQYVQVAPYIPIARVRLVTKKKEPLDKVRGSFDKLRMTNV